MTAFQTLTLDTTAPVLTYGFVRAPAPQEDLIVPVSLDEGYVVEAWFEDHAGQRHDLMEQVDGTWARFIDASVAVGPATIKFRVQDDVLNEYVWPFQTTIGIAIPAKMSGSNTVALISDGSTVTSLSSVSDTAPLNVSHSDTDSPRAKSSTSQRLRVTTTIEVVV